MRLLILTIILLTLQYMAFAQLQPAYTDKQAIRAILGESANQGFNGMLAVAVGIRNRGSLRGVYGLNNPIVDKQPQWVWDMAKKAWAESEHNRIHTGTNWENIKAFGTPAWAKKMVKVYEWKDHIFYKEQK